MIEKTEILEPVPSPGNATPKSWGPVKEKLDWSEAKLHPGRNNPGAVEWLLGKYIHRFCTVHDPMAGIGTTMFLTQKIFVERGYCEPGAYQWRISGWDINPEWRRHWENKCLPLPRPYPDSIDLIVTSPSYYGSNHAPGKGEKQDKYTGKIQSSAGMSWKSDIEGDLGNIKNRALYFDTLRPVYAQMEESLVRGGKAVVIVRDRILRGVPLHIPQQHCDLLEEVGFHLVGAHPRKLEPSARWRQREVLKPGSPFIDTEWNIVLEALK